MVDPRWSELPQTHTEFIPSVYSDRRAWEAKRAHLKRQILSAAGLLPLPEKVPLNAKIWNRIEREGYTIEKVIFQSLPNFYVGGTLYRPLDPTENGHPGVLAPHGHSALGRLNESDAASYQARGLTLARIGCSAFMWDMVDYNDSARHLHGNYEDDTYSTVHRAAWDEVENERLLWNFNLLGVQLWNSVRALDFIETLPEVDPERLICTGESGGGTQTYNLYAVDDRLCAAAPVCMVSASMQGGCICENAPGLRFDTNNVEIGATIAPKPLLLVSSTQDWTRNTPDIEYPAIRQIYSLYGAEHCVEEVQFDAPHGYDKAMREAVYRWIGRVANIPVSAEYEEPKYVTEPRENLLAFYDGLPEGALTDHAALFAEWKRLIKNVIAEFCPKDVNILRRNNEILGTVLRLSVGYEKFETVQDTETDCWEGFVCDLGVIRCSVREVEVPLRIIKPKKDTNSATLIIHPKGIDGVERLFVCELLEKGDIVFLIDSFDIGRNKAPKNLKNPRSENRYFSTFNRTDMSERVGDIARVINHLLTTTDNLSIKVVGLKEAGLWTLLAGACLEIEPTLKYIIDMNNFDPNNIEAYLHYLPIPGILRAGGIVNATALLAPANVLLHNVNTGFNLEWVKMAHALFPYTDLRIREEPLQIRELLTALTNWVSEEERE